ncbi:MAG TPA: cytochrome c, partial [Flavisolibacter sp.]|nr:cytochrome c [Flavisolibacter sp.]
MPPLKLPALIFICVYFTSCTGKNSEAPTIAADSLTIAKGREIFNLNCGSCHNFRQDGIGPNLSGVADTTSIQWLKQFIRDPKSSIDKGDSSLNRLLKRYHTVMPSFTALKDDELNSIIAYLNIHKLKGKKLDRPDPLAIKDPIPEKIDSSDVRAGIQLVAQIPKSSNEKPFARIEKLDVIPGTNRLFILDQRGKLYSLNNHTAVQYLDISTYKPKFIDKPG